MPIHQTIIDNPKSERVRRVAELTNRKARERAGRFLIEGPQSVREAVRYMPQVVRDLYVAVDEHQTPSTYDAAMFQRHGYRDVPAMAEDGLPVSPLVSPIVAQAVEHGIYVHGCSSQVIERMSHDCQGILAVGDVNEMRQSADIAMNDAMVAAFWQVRDPGNAGAVIRAADAAGCRAVVLVDDCVDMLNPKVIRSTAGSLFHLPILSMDTDGFLDWCVQQGLEMVAADVYGTQDHRPESLSDILAGTIEGRGDTTPRPSRTILFGNEARGLPPEILERMDRIVAIPMYGKAESLNLGTSAAVMLMSLAMSSHFGRM